MLKLLKRKMQEFNAVRELRKYATILQKDSKGLNAEQLLELIYGEKWKRFFWIKQVRSEITALCRLIEAKKPKNVLEIGTANGGSLFLNAKLSDPFATIISIDLPGGTFGGGYPSFKEGFYKSFASENQKIHLLRADSHQKESLEQVKNILQGQKVDFLFIDGDHSYEGVKMDYDLYAPLVSDNGVIAFHDIAKHPVTWNVEVDKLWDEVKISFKYQEFIEDEKQGWAGIGIIEKN